MTAGWSLDIVPVSCTSESELTPQTLQSVRNTVAHTKREYRYGERSPLLGQEGCLRIKKISRSSFEAQTGWSVQNDHPVRAFQRMPSAIFFDGTATPPVPGGDYLQLNSLSVTHGKCPNSRGRSMTAHNVAPERSRAVIDRPFYSGKRLSERYRRQPTASLQSLHH